MKLKTIIIGLLIAVFGFTSFAPVMAVRAATDEEINAALSAADESAAAGESVLGSGTAAEALDLPEPGGDSASNTSSPQDSGMDREEIIQKIANAASIMHRIFSPMINAFTFHIGNFLKTDYIFSDAMGTMLKKIWTISRNLVNIIFVFLLLGMALKQIFWVNDDGGGLKQSLIKFAILLVAVNFSWLGTKVVLDAANVVTNAVFAIPMGINSAGASAIKIEPCQIEDGKLIGLCYPPKIFMPINSTSDIQKTDYYTMTECNAEDAKVKAYDRAFTKDGKVNEPVKEEDKWALNTASFCWDTLDFSGYNVNTSMIYLTYGMARIQNITKASGDTSFTQLSVAALLSAVIQAAYAVSLLALLIALIVRMAFLWVFVAFSPFLVLMLYSEKFSGIVKDKLDIGAFVNWAFIPAQVGVIFTIAFLMISAGQTMGTSTLDTLGNGVTVSAKLYKVDSLLMGMNSIQEFLWLLITLAVLWMGTFTVLGKMWILGGITDYIKNAGLSFAKLASTAPLYMPISGMINPSTGQPMSVAKLLAPLNVNSQLRKLRGDENMDIYEEVQKQTLKMSKDEGMQGQARTLFEKGDGNALAKLYGFKSASEALKIDGDALTRFIEQGGGKNASDVSEVKSLILKSAKSGEKSETDRKQYRSDTAAAVEEGERKAEAKKPTGDESGNTTSNP